MIVHPAARAELRFRSRLHPWRPARLRYRQIVLLSSCFRVIDGSHGNEATGQPHRSDRLATLPAASAAARAVTSRLAGGKPRCKASRDLPKIITGITEGGITLYGGLIGGGAGGLLHSIPWAATDRLAGADTDWKAQSLCIGRSVPGWWSRNHQVATFAGRGEVNNDSSPPKEAAVRHLWLLRAAHSAALNSSLTSRGRPSGQEFRR